MQTLNDRVKTALEANRLRGLDTKTALTKALLDTYRPKPRTEELHTTNKDNPTLTTPTRN